MGGIRLSTRSEFDPRPSIDAYVHELGDALRGPRSWRQRVLAETRDGMFSELDEHPDLAERDVVTSWGPVDEIARDFNKTGHVLVARRLAWNLLRFIPVLAIGWGLVVQLSPDPWRAEPTLIGWVAPLLFVSTAIAILGAGQATRGSASRGRTGGETRGVILSCVGMAVGVACLAVLLSYRLLASHGHIFWPGTIVTGALTLTVSIMVGFHAWYFFQPRALIRHLPGSAD